MHGQAQTMPTGIQAPPVKGQAQMRSINERVLQWQSRQSRLMKRLLKSA